jgi:hypothetical protein
VNKTFEEKVISVRLVSPEGKSTLVAGKAIRIKPDSYGQSAVFVDIKPENLTGTRTQIVFEILDQKGNVLETVKTNFLATGLSARK